jgi:hypothetical protein
MRTGTSKWDAVIRVMFDTTHNDTIFLHAILVRLGLRASGGPLWLTCKGEDPRYSSCKYVVPVLDWKGHREWIRTVGAQRGPGGSQGGVPGESLGGPKGQPGGGPGGHDHQQGQPRVDALPGEGGGVRTVHPDVDETQLALHPQGEQASLAGDQAQRDGSEIGGVFCASFANFLSSPRRMHSKKKDRERTRGKAEKEEYGIVVCCYLVCCT